MINRDIHGIWESITSNLTQLILFIYSTLALSSIFVNVVNWKIVWYNYSTYHTPEHHSINWQYNLLIVLSSSGACVYVCVMSDAVTNYALFLSTTFTVILKMTYWEKYIIVLSIRYVQLLWWTIVFCVCVTIVSSRYSWRRDLTWTAIACIDVVATKERTFFT